MAVPKSVNPVTGIKGMDVVLANLNREILLMEERSNTGLIEAAILIRRDMDMTPPLIPIDLGNLRASWFTVTGKGKGGEVEEGAGFSGPKAGDLQTDRQAAIAEGQAVASAYTGPMVMLGFSANYAMFVHENIGASFKRPGAGAKFFESALKRNKDAILQLIGTNASIKK